MTTGEAINFSVNELEPVYGNGEARAMTDLLLEKLTGYRGAALVSRAGQALDAELKSRLHDYIHRLHHHEPIQYMLEEAWFADLKLYVDGSVLIPRPETEELVEWIVADRRYRQHGTRILDIGTGSGCIPLALKKKLARVSIDAVDISGDSLTVARRNSTALGLPVNFIQMDILAEEQWHNLGDYNIIVSNPPYIPVAEKKEMDNNVAIYEPGTALFVPDEDPLLFYRAIADFGKKHLTEDGRIYVEIYEQAGKETLEVFTSNGYTAILRTDMQGRDRMIRAELLNIRHNLGT